MAVLRTARSPKLWELARSITPRADSSGPLHPFWNFESLRALLLLCRRSPAAQDGRSLHSVLIRTGSCRDVFFANNLVCLYADFGCIGDARKMFDEMPDRNVVSWTTAISAFTRAGEPQEAVEVFNRMVACGEWMPNGYTFSAALKACALTGEIELGRWIHERFMNLGLQCDTVLMNAALDMYVKCQSLGEARMLFDDIPSRNLTSWNTIIAGYAEVGDMYEAERLFFQIPNPDVVSYNTIIAGFAHRESPNVLEYVLRMHKHGISLDEFTFPCALKGCGVVATGNMGKQIHCCVIKLGFELDCLTGSAIIDMYAKCGAVDGARQAYAECSRNRRSGFDMLALSNSMISALVSNGHNGSALGLVSECHCSGIALDVFTLSSALKACIGLHNLRFGLQLHNLVVVSGYRLDHIVGSVLIYLYLKCGDLEKAFALFNGLPRKDVVTWGGLIAGCVQHGSHQFAFSLFRDMIRLNVEVDGFVLSSVLKACSVLSRYNGGKQVHAYSMKKGFAAEGAMITSFIDMYAKSGEIEDALTVFRAAKERDTLCWTGIIMGCGQNGRAKEAIEIFREMAKLGPEPNEVTFLCVLSACRHAGLVEDACSIFEAMKNKNGIAPSLEHYCCMVDILGRAGLINDAWRLISEMPHKPDEAIWSSLLAASGVHDTDISRVAAERLLPVASFNTPALVTLSNTFASLGMWDSSIKLKDVIKRVGMKEAGMSWVEVRS